MISSVDVKRQKKGAVGVIEHEELSCCDSEHEYYFNVGDKAKPFRIEKKLSFFMIVKL